MTNAFGEAKGIVFLIPSSLFLIQVFALPTASCHLKPVTFSPTFQLSNSPTSQIYETSSLFNFPTLQLSNFI